MTNILSVKNLNTRIKHQGQNLVISDNIHLELRKNEILGIVGESGSGKTMTVLSLAGLIPASAESFCEEFLFEDRKVDLKNPEVIKGLRGRGIAYIFQEAQAHLNPIFSIGEQLKECVMYNLSLTKQRARQEALRLLEEAGLSPSQDYYDRFPHQLSGGMNQRVMIAMAISSCPKILIADEPTSALDVTIEKTIVRLIQRLVKKLKLSVIWITHDISLIQAFADRLAVMYAARIVEIGPAKQIYTQPFHPYTQALISSLPENFKKSGLSVLKGEPPSLASLPSGCKFHPRCSSCLPRCAKDEPDLIEVCEGQKSRCDLVNAKNPALTKSIGALAPLAPRHFSGGLSPLKGKARFPLNNPSELPLLQRQLLIAKDITKRFPLDEGFFKKSRGDIKALDKVNFTLETGEVLGVVGESGSGKTTLARITARVIQPTEGEIIFSKEMTQPSKDIQIIFQNPFESLDPQMSIRESILEPLRVNKFPGAPEEQLSKTLKLLQLSEELMDRLPHQLSGGQRQKIIVARAVAAEPKLLICDEPTSSLDLCMQAHILNILMELKDIFKLTMLFISHNISVIKIISDRIMVMYSGIIAEIGEREAIYGNPAHPYTRHLIEFEEMKFDEEQDRKPLADVQGLKGCRYLKCLRRRKICEAQMPGLEEISPDHWAACHFPQKSIKIKR